jgi:hypothetical protein
VGVEVSEVLMTRRPPVYANRTVLGIILDCSDLFTPTLEAVEMETDCVCTWIRNSEVVILKASRQSR